MSETAAHERRRFARVVIPGLSARLNEASVDIPVKDVSPFGIGLDADLVPELEQGSTGRIALMRGGHAKLGDISFRVAHRGNGHVGLYFPTIKDREVEVIHRLVWSAFAEAGYGRLPDDDSAETRIMDRMAKLIEANHYIAKIDRLEDLLPKLLETAEDVTNAEASSIWYLDSDLVDMQMSFIRNRHLSPEGIEKLKDSVHLKVGEGIAGWVAETKQPVVVPDASKDPRFAPMVDAISGFTTRSLICAPILHRNELTGVVQVLNPVGKASFDQEDLAALEYFADLAAVSIIRQKLLDDKIKQSRLSVEMEAAAEIQSRFRPEIPCLGCDTHAWGYSENASFVGGDLYDFISLDDGTFLAYLADVCGKGLPASLIMAALWSRMRSEAHLIKEPHLLLENVNKSLFTLLSGGLTLATAVVGRYHPDIGRLDFSLAGHPPPIRLGDGMAGTVPDAKGMPLGISETVSFERKSVYLQPGESVVFYSDGVTEAMNKEKDMFGIERLLAFAETIDKRPVGGIITEELRRWRGEGEPADDTTILEIWRECGDSN